MRVKAIIFDLDGTLVDTIEDIGAAANTLLLRHGYPQYGKDEFVQWIGNGASSFIEQGLGGGISEPVLAKYVAEFKDIYGANYAVKSKLFKDIDLVLDQLYEKGIKLSILSNKPHALTVKVCDNYLVNWKFDPIFGQREEIPRKPDPAAALEIADMLKISPAEIAFVGDSEGDINTALAAGMQPVGVSWGYGKMDIAHEQGIPVIDAPRELLRYS